MARGTEGTPPVPDAQKYFADPLTGEDVAFFEKNKKAIVYRILERNATPGELYDKIVLEVERARVHGMEDIISQDYYNECQESSLEANQGCRIRRARGPHHRSEEAGESNEVKFAIAAVQELVAGPTKNSRNTTLAGVLKP
ncbi:unnamed protein product [Ectocarpus sp. CCAP 1310/34]|nr:unnamed protein product [Ectocarpus sp. CCAP 1310/34]